MKKEYKTPAVDELGSVAELTLAGLTNPGGDAKAGSVLSAGQ